MTADKKSTVLDKLFIFWQIKSVAVSITCGLHILEQSLFLCSQSILVGLAWIAAQVTMRIAAVHGMMLGQSVWLLNVGLIECAMALGNLYLPSNMHVCFMSAS